MSSIYTRLFAKIADLGDESSGELIGHLLGLLQAIEGTTDAQTRALVAAGIKPERLEALLPNAQDSAFVSAEQQLTDAKRALVEQELRHQEEKRIAYATRDDAARQHLEVRTKLHERERQLKGLRDALFEIREFADDPEDTDNALIKIHGFARAGLKVFSA